MDEKRGISIAAIQETRIGMNTRESRKGYTWYYCGENGTIQGYTAGVAIVVENNLVKHILDIEPINDRLMYITSKGTINYCIIATHVPQAERPTEEKEKIYKGIKEITRKNKGKGTVIILGDMNARIQKAANNRERRYIGEHTFEPETCNIHGRSEGITENRNLMIDLCQEFDMRALNTCFRKTKDKLATFREVGTTREDEIKREHMSN